MKRCSSTFKILKMQSKKNVQRHHFSPIRPAKKNMTTHSEAVSNRHSPTLVVARQTTAALLAVNWEKKTNKSTHTLTS